MIPLFIIALCAALVGLAHILTRTMVDPNEVHVVTRGRQVTSYGQGLPAGNVYQNWPSFLPVIGVKKRVLPVNNFSVPVDSYDAYDILRTPLMVDAVGFFRIADTNLAAKRIESPQHLRDELLKIMRGALRNILASSGIDQIMGDRSTFGDKLNAAISEDVKAWGVEITRTMEIMDVRDGKGSTVIADIMAKNISAINRDSRSTVAENNRAAKEAEIAAAQSVELRGQEMAREVGKKTADVKREVGVANEQAAQEIQQEAATTMQRKMEVVSVETQRTAEIKKSAAITLAEGDLQATQLEATGIQATGVANAEAKRLAEMAIVTPQLELAKGTTNNTDYQDYLVRVRQVEADEKVGVAQAQALAGADIKIIANSEGIASGLSGARGLLSSKTGQGIGAVLEGIASTPEGSALLDRLTPRIT